MQSDASIFDAFADSYKGRTEKVMTLQEYLEGCKTDPMMYAGAAQRMLAAIGEPELLDTSDDPRLGRIFMNRTIKRYPAFANFYGLEETIERIVGFFRHAAQGLEERKQILYLLGPVGGGKSSLSEALKQLMEKHPIYVLAFEREEGGPHEMSPVYESPLGLFDPDKMGARIESDYGVPKRLLTGHLSPWAVKRLDEAQGDLSRFKVVQVHPSKLRQIGVAKTEPGDENNQDVSALVGKIDIRKLEYFGQNDPDAYSYSGGLNVTTQGLLEFVEMFKAPIKMLHPLLTATQDGTYVGTENVGALPYQGVILAHSNESEWQSFRNNKNNEAFLDRICVIKVPYCLRVTEEERIYEKLLSASELSDASRAPGTLQMLARFSVLTRLKEHANSALFSKMRVYDGESLKETDPSAKTVQEYRDVAGVDEGMDGVSTRFAYKILSETFNFDTREVAADPVHLMYVLEQAIRREQLPTEAETQYIEFVKEELAPRYAEFIGNEKRASIC
ncbi:MAG: PrkA family serine protein kinase, partial [Pseudomonadota bacterium]